MKIKVGLKKALLVVGTASISFLFLLASLYPQEKGIVEVEVEGQAAIVGGKVTLARDQAIEAAKRNAVEQGIGTLVASETLTKNFALVSDRILNKSTGFVKKFEIVKEGEEGGVYSVTIKAQVTEIIDQIVQDQLALDLLLEYMDRPRLMIVINESNIGDTNSRVAETEMIRVFATKNFDLVDQSQVEAVRASEQANQAIAGNAVAAAALGAQFGAELVITGRAVGSDGGKVAGFVSGQGDIAARAIRTDTAAILTAGNEHAAKPHLNATTAGANALKEAGAKIANTMIKEIVKRWKLESSNVVNVELVVSGVSDIALLNVFKDAIGSIPNVKGVQERAFSGGVARLNVNYEGKGTQLSDDILGRQFEGFEAKITGRTPNKLTMEIAAKAAPAPATSTIDLEVSGMDGYILEDITVLIDFEDALAKVEGVKAVKEGDFDQGVAKLSLTYDGDGRKFVRTIARHKFEGFEARITRAVGDKVSMAIKPK